MSGVFQNIDPYPPTPSPPHGFGVRGVLGEKGGGGSIFWKTTDTAMFSTYVSAGKADLKYMFGSCTFIPYVNIFCSNTWFLKLLKTYL